MVHLTSFYLFYSLPVDRELSTSLPHKISSFSIFYVCIYMSFTENTTENMRRLSFRDGWRDVLDHIQMNDREWNAKRVTFWIIIIIIISR